MVKAISGLPTKIQKGSAVLRIRTVCDTCNNGWMSQLEEDAIPVLRPLLLDFQIPLSSEQQVLLAVWAMKTGMVLDSIHKHAHFYQKDERKNLRENRILPAGTVIWIGRFFGNGKHAGLSDFSLDSAPDLKVASGCVITWSFKFSVLGSGPVMKSGGLMLGSGLEDGTNCSAKSGRIHVVKSLGPPGAVFHAV